jgi:hypothetical protein
MFIDHGTSRKKETLPKLEERQNNAVILVKAKYFCALRDVLG